MLTPITDAVRDQRGDYLTLVEDLEESHCALKQALQRLLRTHALNGAFLSPSDHSSISYARDRLGQANGLGDSLPPEGTDD